MSTEPVQLQATRLFGMEFVFEEGRLMPLSQHLVNEEDRRRRSDERAANQRSRDEAAAALIPDLLAQAVGIDGLAVPWFVVERRRNGRRLPKGTSPGGGWGTSSSWKAFDIHSWEVGRCIRITIPDGFGVALGAEKRYRCYLIRADGVMLDEPSASSRVSDLSVGEPLLVGCRPDDRYKSWRGWSDHIAHQGHRPEPERSGSAFALRDAEKVLRALQELLGLPEGLPDGESSR